MRFASNDRSKYFRVLTDVMLCVIAGLLLLRIVRSRQTNPTQPPTITYGSRLASVDIDWARSQRTLLIALAEGCRYCEMSAPFFKTISTRLRSIPGVTLAVATPHSVEQGTRYARRLGLEPKQVVQVSLVKMGVPGTPATIMLDRKGLVIGAWMGMLRPQDERVVLGQLGSSNPSTVADPIDGDHVGPGDVTVATRLTEGVTKRLIVDLRERQDYARGHPRGAINIPLLELQSRASDELNPARLIILYCGNESSCSTSGAEVVGPGAVGCETGRSRLLSLGFSNVSILREDATVLGDVRNLPKRPSVMSKKSR